MQTAAPALNRNTTFRIVVAAMFIFFLSHSASAQDFNHMNFSLGAGFSTPVYNSGSSLNYGWNFDARGGVAINSELLADLDFTYSHSNFNNATLAKFGEPNGGASIWSLTFNPVVRLAPRAAKFRPYVTGGYGLYHLNFSVSHPTTVPTILCSAFFGCVPALVGANAVVASDSTYRAGFNAGAGFDMPIGEGHRMGFFAEARYEEIFMGSDRNYQLVPVTFGFRW
jgi:Outer membrane protein beta-barrel domain